MQGDLNDIQQSLLIYAMNNELEQASTLEQERFKYALIAAHPENTKQILKIFNKDEEEKDDYVPEESDEPLEIDGFDITDIVQGISENGGFITDVTNAPL